MFRVNYTRFDIFHKLVLFSFFCTIPSYCYLLLDGNSEWTPFCDEKLYYKPYIRIHDGRNGPVLRDRGPGFINLKGMEDLYICANGLVFYYFKTLKLHGDLYDDAVVQYAPHYCAFFNGKFGPETGARKSTLVAMLLIGHPDDYRKISLQLFTAPLYDSVAKATTNFTSLAVIGLSGECIIEKGSDRARIRVRGNLPTPLKSYVYKEDEERHTTICRLDGTTHGGQDTTKVPLEPNTATVEEVVQALTLNTDLKFVGCYKYPLISSKQMDIINAKTADLASDHVHIDKGKSELNPQDGEGLSFWTKERLAQYGNPVEAPDETTLKTDADAKNATYQTEHNATPKDHAKITAAKQEKDSAYAKLYLAPYFKEYKIVYDLASKYGQDATTDWTAVADFLKTDDVNHTMYNHTKALLDVSHYTFERKFYPYSSVILENITESETMQRQYLAKLTEHTDKVGPLITKAEVSSARHKSYMHQALTLMDLIRKSILDFERDHIPIQQYVQPPKVHLDTVVSIQNEGGVEDACMTFERRQDQCKTIKPAVERVTQIATRIMGKGGDWPEAADSWRDKVFDIMEKIFTKACPYLQKEFVVTINQIVKGYLIKEPKGTGVDDILPGSPFVNSTMQNFVINYKITKPEDLYSPLKPKEEDWDEIIAALEKCEQNETNHPIKFEYKSMHPLILTYMGNPIIHNVEQADKEYSFNWAIDTNYRIFGTVLGFCSSYLQTGGLMTEYFFQYLHDILNPIRTIWLSNRDNPIFKVILGKYYVTGKGDLWTKNCMEASFLPSHAQHRPLRPLYVNSHSELNFFAGGPLKGIKSIYKNSKPNETDMLDDSWSTIFHVDR